MIYLDNAATTFLDRQVASFICSFYKKDMGNASSQHRLGIQAAVVIEKARQVIAGSIKADPKEIFFFSGGTEANNTVIKGIALARKRQGNHVIVSAIEHPSILEPARWLQRQGFRVSYLPVNPEGFVDPADVKRAMTPRTILVSVMHANNEIGTIEPIRPIGALCRKRGVIFHTDACQSFTKVPLDVECDCLDAVTLNGHKIHGPRGVGALYVRKGLVLDAFMHGGHQENGMRAGTYNTEGIAGFGKAVEIADNRDVARMTKLRDYCIQEIENRIAGVSLNGPRQQRLCNNLNFSFSGAAGKELFLLLNAGNIFVSTASACSSNALQASHVLQALNVNDDRAHGAVRISLSKKNTKEEIDHVVSSLAGFLKKIRRKI